MDVIRTSDGFTISIIPQYQSNSVAIDTGRGPLRLTTEEAHRLLDVLERTVVEVENYTENRKRKPL